MICASHKIREKRFFLVARPFFLSLCFTLGPLSVILSHSLSPSFFLLPFSKGTTQDGKRHDLMIIMAKTAASNHFSTGKMSTMRIYNRHEIRNHFTALSSSSKDFWLQYNSFRNFIYANRAHTHTNTHTMRLRDGGIERAHNNNAMKKI